MPQSNFTSNEEIHPRSDDESDQDVERHPFIDDEAVDGRTTTSINSMHEDLMRSFDGFHKSIAFGLLDSYRVHHSISRFVRQLP